MKYIQIRLYMSVVYGIENNSCALCHTLYEYSIFWQYIVVNYESKPLRARVPIENDPTTCEPTESI